MASRTLALRHRRSVRISILDFKLFLSNAIRANVIITLRLKEASLPLIRALIREVTPADVAGVRPVAPLPWMVTDRVPILAADNLTWVQACLFLLLSLNLFRHHSFGEILLVFNEFRVFIDQFSEIVLHMIVHL